MTKVNQNFLKLPGSYLFSEVARRISVYSAAHPQARIIKLSIGDVTRPLAPAVIQAMHRAVDEMGTFEGFHGYGPEQGYDFLREAIAKTDYAARGVDIKPEEIFVSDGAKSDCGNIGDIFGTDNVVAVCDPVYPVYVDTNAMAGRAGEYQEELGRWSRLVYMPCVAENGFTPEPPQEKVDLIYLCFPNNPTGGIMERKDLEEIAKVLDIPREEVVFAMDAIVDPVSLYEPIYDSGGDAICVMDQVSDTKNTDERWTERIALKDAMKLLDPRERRILSLRFYEGKTQMEVSAEVGISQAQVSRLEKGAINTIRKHL